MTQRDLIIQVAARLQCTIEWTDDGFIIDAPPCAVFTATQRHSIPCSRSNDIIETDGTVRKPRMSELYIHAINDMEQGVSPCPDSDCPCCTS